MDKMRIEVDRINGIKPGNRLSHDNALQVDITMSYRQQKDAVYRVWENLGENLFLELITSEGYNITKIKEDKTELEGEELNGYENKKRICNGGQNDARSIL